MPVPVPTTAASTAAPKTKTKAKQRYLKVKKNRRKNREAAAAKQTKKPVQEKEQGSSSSGSEDRDAESSADEADETEGPTAPVVVEVTAEKNDAEDEDANMMEVEPTVPESGKKEKRPRKRVKLSPPPEADVDMDDATVDKHVEDEPMEDEAAPSFLASFPLPTKPAAASKTTLALQGLDKALLEAELVDPKPTVPVEEFTGPNGPLRTLSERTKKRLFDLGITEFFAVQIALLPMLLPDNKLSRVLYNPYFPQRDICASAPTGSGKTLAYVIPIVETLSQRIVVRLRALIVLPTRDLVIQVKETFEALSKGHGLRIGVATGQHSFAHEREQLVEDQVSDLQGGSSKVDILICTPGRLIDHLNGTKNFTLQHLRFLVIDEADRLLSQSFQDWLSRVLAAIRPPPLPITTSAVLKQSTDQLLPLHDALSPAWLHTSRSSPYIRTDVDDEMDSSCQKLLFSATLTRDPSKIAAIKLRNPKYVVVQGSNKEGEDAVHAVATESFTMPLNLKEHMLVCDSAQKPLMLFHLLHAHSVTRALVFTKSTEAVTRLVRLFEFFEEAWAAEDAIRKSLVVKAYSSDLSRQDRKNILEEFKSSQIDILICSDLISRGIDISQVSHVVSYDVPIDMRKYVHRVGRTARAGREGHAWTLIEEQEARYFKSMLKEAHHLDQVVKLKVKGNDVEPLMPLYNSALNKLKEVYGRSNLNSS